jgi:hypothetical protein
MAGADLFAYLKAKADYCAAIPGIKGSIFPAVGHPAPGTLPCLIVFESSPIGNYVYEDNTDGSMWTIETMGQVLIANKGDTARIIAQGIALLQAVKDSFSYNLDGRNPAIDAIDAGGPIDYLQLHQSFLGGIQYAGQSYYGADLYWRTKFHRYPEATP